MKKSRFFALIAILCAALAACLVWGLLSGSVQLPANRALEAVSYLLGRGGDKTAAALIFGIRLPRLLLALFVGSSLGTAGACFQGLFRNPLADPYIIGASSGAALGAALAAAFALNAVSAFNNALNVQGLCAFAGSLGAVLLVFSITRISGNSATPGTLILAGTSVSAFCAALLALVLVIKDRNLVQVYYWLLGSLSGTTWFRLFSVLPFMILGNIAIFLSVRPLDLLLQGEDAASSLGLNPLKTRFILAIAATLPVAAAVSVTGVIGFVGLIAPHSVRFFTGPGHRRLLPASALAGGLLCLAADNLARLLIPPAEIPLGVITSLAGAPFFLFLLTRRKNKGGLL